MYKEVKVNLHYRHSLQVTKKKKAGSKYDIYANYPKVTADDEMPLFFKINVLSFIDYFKTEQHTHQQVDRCFSKYDDFQSSSKVVKTVLRRLRITTVIGNSVV